VPPFALSDAPIESQQLMAVLGGLLVLFSIGNVGLRIWAERRLRAGKSLPGPFRGLRAFVDYRRLFLAALCVQAGLGVILLAIALVRIVS
jgi:hypothetical protein